MDLSHFISAEAILPTLKCSSKKQLLQALSEHGAKLCNLPERDLFDTLLERERLGSTGIGDGIAIPHGKLSQLDQLVGIFVRLDKPVDFEAADDQPVDLIFALFAPEGAGADHLKALSRIARLLRDETMVEKIRATSSAEALYALLTQPPESRAA